MILIKNYLLVRQNCDKKQNRPASLLPPAGLSQFTPNNAFCGLVALSHDFENELKLNPKSRLFIGFLAFPKGYESSTLRAEVC